MAGSRFPAAAQEPARNPLVQADLPDPSIIRVGSTYYMSSTTMHLSPGLPILRSTDLVNWQLLDYAYDTLTTTDAMTLAQGRSTYGRGSWASSLRYHRGTFYVSTFAQTTGRTHVYSTRTPGQGPWQAVSFRPSLHDHSLFFEDDGRAYMVYGSGRIQLAELRADLSGLRPGTTPQVLIENASAPAGAAINLPAEGSQLFKIHGRYYLFNIVWPQNGMRTVVVHRADSLRGPYEGRVVLQDKGVAQGGLIDTPAGDWYAYLFRDYGAVGRIPYLVPVSWQQGWPVLGAPAGQVPDTLPLPANTSPGVPGLVAADEFSRRRGEPALPLVWQWNHNPVRELWSLTERPGYLRLRTGRVDTSFLQARNTLTQRTFGPRCSATTALDVRHLREGDFAGLGLLQRRYGLVGVQVRQGVRSLVMVSAGSEKPVELQRLPLRQGRVYLRIDCDFEDRRDVATFFYSLDATTWHPLGGPLQMAYTLPHFMGYRFALFNYATRAAGGYADFDYFHITDQPGPQRPGGLR
ncbi:glycoside hydrolase 43 family protein [Hymenobacter sp. NST-14]|uniref:glycoside hydrolase family 43 protein n=1 Tax=Hymenobacter piscis TaxID=2839984 RepID=UPI001C02316F|nr:glycoside hydrolase 43 family protein [Hymenobacter piscis]MBT9395249.1 glycoside hydrolase 43 family protein [Hymenobacter piscis]